MESHASAARATHEGDVDFDLTPEAEGSSLDRVLLKLNDDDFALARDRLTKGTRDERRAAVEFARKQLSRGEEAQVRGRRRSWLEGLCDSDVGTFKLLAALEKRGEQQRSRDGSITETYYMESEISVDGDINVGYVLVEHEDVLDAVLEFLTEAVRRHPEAEDWSSDELHAALVQGIKEIKDNPAILVEADQEAPSASTGAAVLHAGGAIVGAVRSIWSWGSAISGWVRTGYEAWQMYTNPWLVRAVVRGLWTSCRYLVRGR